MKEKRGGKEEGEEGEGCDEGAYRWIGVVIEVIGNIFLLVMNLSYCEGGLGW